MAAEPGDVQALARKLRAKGQTDEQIVTALRGLGFSKSDAEGAVAALGSTSPAPLPTKTPAGGRRPARRSPQRPETPAAVPATPGTSTSWSMPSMPSVPPLTLTPPRRLDRGDLGGFALGLFAYVLAINFIRGGPDGVKAWMRAKFLNEPSSDFLGSIDDALENAQGTQSRVPDSAIPERGRNRRPRRGGDQPVIARDDRDDDGAGRPDQSLTPANTWQPDKAPRPAIATTAGPTRTATAPTAAAPIAARTPAKTTRKTTKSRAAKPAKSRK